MFVTFLLLVFGLLIRAQAVELAKRFDFCCISSAWRVSIHENTAIMGSFEDQEAFIFQYDEDTEEWSQTQTLTASDTNAGDRFGEEVVTFNNITLIAARWKNTTYYQAGVIYVFCLNPSTQLWFECDTLTRSDTYSDSWNFGWRIAINSEYLVVGSFAIPGEDEAAGSYTYTGRAYVYKYSYDDVNYKLNIVQEWTLIGDDTGSDDYFGIDVAIDSNWDKNDDVVKIIVGAYRQEDSSGLDRGAAYIFGINASADSWEQYSKLVPQDPADSDSWEAYGWAVAMDGNYSIVGARNYDSNIYGASSGKAYVYRRNNNNDYSWSKIQELTQDSSTSVSSSGDFYGFDVAMYDEKAAISMPAQNDENYGSVYLYQELDGDNDYTKIAVISPTDFDQQDRFGQWVAMDDKWLIVSARYGDAVSFYTGFGPTAAPTEIPTSDPTQKPTSMPTSIPSVIPSAVPSSLPSRIPTTEPSGLPTKIPTGEPTRFPSSFPTTVPSGLPTSVPSEPTASPTLGDRRNYSVIFEVASGSSNDDFEIFVRIQGSYEINDDTDISEWTDWVSIKGLSENNQEYIFNREFIADVSQNINKLTILTFETNSYLSIECFGVSTSSKQQLYCESDAVDMDASSSNSDSCFFVEIDFKTNTSIAQTDSSCRYSVENYDIYNSTSMTTQASTATSTPNVESTAEKMERTSTTTATMTTTTKTTEEETNVAEANSLGEFSNGIVIFVYGLLIVMILFMLMAWVWHRQKGKESDGPVLLSFVRFGTSVGDFWTDLLFMVVLIFEADSGNGSESIRVICYLAIVFTILPFTLSCCFAVYQTERWKIRQNSRLSDWIRDHGVVIFGLTIIAGFHTAVELVRSKAFYLKMFHFPLKRDEYQNLKNSQFLLVVVLENIPQLCIQMAYLTIKTDSSDNGLNLIAFISMVFSVLSIISSIMAQTSRICQCFRTRAGKYGYNITINGCLCLKSSSLKHVHAFAHNKIRRCIFDTIQATDEGALKQIVRNSRSDVAFSVEVFYFEDHISTMKELNCYFEIEILSHDRNVSKLFQNELINMVTIIANAGPTTAAIKLNKSLKRSLKLDDVFCTMEDIVTTSKSLISDRNSVLLHQQLSMASSMASMSATSSRKNSVPAPGSPVGDPVLSANITSAEMSQLSQTSMNSMNKMNGNVGHEQATPKQEFLLQFAMPDTPGQVEGHTTQTGQQVNSTMTNGLETLEETRSDNLNMGESGEDGHDVENDLETPI